MIGARDCIKALQRAGFRVDRQTGSHITLRHDERAVTVTIPNHKELARGMLRAIIRQAGLTVDEFLDYLR